MFTGLIEAVGKVAGVSPLLRIEAPFSHELSEGESVAVEGVCLTVARTSGANDRAKGGWFEADVVPETLSKTTLGSLKPNVSVNLERALKVGDRLGGHFVQGHVDEVGKVVEFRKQGDDVRLFVEIPAALRRFIAEKGSIALSGVSLTVASVSQLVMVEVALIPHTLAHTTLGNLREGDHVNLEVDLLARYLEVGRGTSTK